MLKHKLVSLKGRVSTAEPRCGNTAPIDYATPLILSSVSLTEPTDRIQTFADIVTIDRLDGIYIEFLG